MSQNIPGDTTYAPPGPTALSPEEERTWATLTHVGVGAATVLSAGTLGFFAALGVYLLHKDRGPFIRHNAANAMNIQLNMLMWAAISVVLMLVLVGFVLLAAVPIVGVVLHVVAAIKANRGEWYDPPLTIRFIR
ncbi:MAG TPA: DUF4870 domain-containing protein [Nocardioides sp.]|nr:DUF4870 domain-containing protein [Nocardioides sp.]